MFANEAKLMRRIKTEEDIKQLQDGLDKLNKLSNKWLLKFNSSKCKVMKLDDGSRSPNTRNKLGDDVLHESDRETGPGGDITPNLSPEANIKKRPHHTSVTYTRLANIRTALRNLCKESLRTFYTTYVTPILEYAAPARSPYLVKHKTKLEKVQRYATRLVPELRGMNYEERLLELQLTILQDRRVREDMITTYKILKGTDRADKERLFKTGGTRTRGHL
ncbi:uncharacterized protein [Procambarus clarkii]|uniref:uncharacterized protein n=1 Tax=Procambarus clarkii TaxID=6728 RepID=UPI003742DBF2